MLQLPLLDPVREPSHAGTTTSKLGNANTFCMEAARATTTTSSRSPTASVNVSKKVRIERISVLFRAFRKVVFSLFYTEFFILLLFDIIELDSC